jgi:hypothetical protein
VAVECDEESHRRETVLCEVTRMLDVAAQYTLCSELPLHFVRFNPDSYTVDGRAHKPLMGARHRELTRNRGARDRTAHYHLHLLRRDQWRRGRDKIRPVSVGPPRLLQNANGLRRATGRRDRTTS